MLYDNTHLIKTDHDIVMEIMLRHIVALVHNHQKGKLVHLYLIQTYDTKLIKITLIVIFEQMI